ncbi:divergent PAP2 family protein [Candidatus Aerophobetes bacterium]|nr:divergent PAP2 family protein [Candidatus Aerophobetes bacterium]
MLKILYFILNHPLLMAVFWAWILAQALKVVVSAMEEKKLKLRRFIEPGGMPSSHAAAVVALLTGVGIKQGVGSTIFIIVLVLALVTMYEAIGVRREVGKQAEFLNELIQHLAYQANTKLKLKESMGHSPIEVLVGGIVGFFMALLWM